MKETMNYQGREWSVQKIIPNLGFRWKKTESIRKELV